MKKRKKAKTVVRWDVIHDDIMASRPSFATREEAEKEAEIARERNWKGYRLYRVTFREVPARKKRGKP